MFKTLKVFIQHKTPNCVNTSLPMKMQNHAVEQKCTCSACKSDLDIAHFAGLRYVMPFLLSHCTKLPVIFSLPKQLCKNFASQILLPPLFITSS